MVVRCDYNKSQMTLALAVHNGTDIILAADSMAIETFAQDDREQIHLNHRKIFPINDHSALAIAGRFNTTQVASLLKGFLYFAQKSNDDVDSLHESFCEYILRTTDFEQGDSLAVIIAGYTKEGKPKIYCVERICGELKHLVPISEYYDIIGYNDPKNYAEAHIKSMGEVSGKEIRTSKLRKFASNIVKTTIKEFPGKVGGTPKTVVLKKPK